MTLTPGEAINQLISIAYSTLGKTDDKLEPCPNSCSDLFGTIVKCAKRLMQDELHDFGLDHYIFNPGCFANYLLIGSLKH